MCKICTRKIWDAILKVNVTAWHWIKIVSGPLLRYLKSDLKTILQKWSPYWDDEWQPRFGSPPWRSRSHHDLAAKLCLPHNLVIWSLILQLFHSNDHHIEATCREQHSGWYLEGQGHTMILQQNPIRPITLLFKVGFYNYFTKWSPHWDDMSRATFGSLPWRSMSQHDLAADTCPAHNLDIWNRILQLYLTEMITILRWCVTTLPIVWLCAYSTALY